MKYLTYLMLSCITLSAGSQSIQNTIWKTYNVNLFDTVTIEIGVNTVNQFIGSFKGW